MENNANVFNNEVSFQNFHLNTIANFQEITEADLPNRPPDFISDSGSKYWHEGDVVIRQANHWGAENMSGCNWMLNYSSSKVLSQGKCKLNHFRNKNIVKILDSETNNRNFTNNTTKDDIRHIISGTYKVSYGANIQATTRYIRESTGAILETTGSRVSKEKEETYLKKYITDNNLWYLTPLPKPFGRGFEQTVYLIDEKYVIKTNNGIAFDSWLDYLNNLLLHNYFFPQTAYELLGFTENNGKLLSVVKQLFIEATEETDLNFLKYYLLRRGFEYIRNNNYQNFELGIIVKDLHGENVLTENGILQFIDTDFYLEKNYSDKFNDGGVIQSKPSYLMTLQEYQQTVTPILQEYNKFIKKNQQYFTKADFNGIFYYTFPELLADVKKGKQKGFKFRKGEYDKGLTDDEFARKSFSYRTVGRFDKEYEPEPIPNALTEKKNEYIDKLKQFFTEEEIVRLIETDETKSNKRSVKRAIDNNTYKTLLEEGKVTLEQIEKVATSVEVKLPKKVLDEGTLRTQENKAIYDKIYALMPSVNREVLSKMVDDVKETFKPLETIIYDKETKRYEELILETYKQNEADVDELNRWLEFYKEIFTFEKQEKRTKLINDKPFKTDWLVGLSLKNDWQQTVIKYVLAYIERLKANMIYSIIDNFKKITQPIENIEQIALKVGIKGFEGEYKFNFKNGSSFIFKTEAIGAGGYNIQTYHFRYLTHFTDIILADGTKASNKISIVEHFSDKQISEQIFNPYFAVKNSENIEQIIEALYNYLKSNSFYNNIRKSISKDGGSLSYKEWQGRLAGNYFYIKRSDSLDENKNKAYNLLEKLKVKKPDGFDSNNSEVKKFTLGGFVGSINNNKVDSFIDNQGRKRFYIDDWTAKIREDIVYETIENVNKSNTPQEYKLSEIMYLWDGYKYYPNLADISIVFYKDEFDEKNAYYDLRTGKININCIKLTKDYDRYIDYTRKHESAFTERGNDGKFKKRILGRPEYIIRLLRRKLLHESQHILQRLEGIQPISTALNDVVHYVRKKYNVEHLSASDFNSFISEKHNTTYKIAIYKEYRLIPTEQECFDVEEALQQKFNELDERESGKIKILYLHGLGATPESDKVKLLERDNVEIIAPYLDYNKGLVFGFLSDELIDKENIQAIVGHSIGGYLAYYLSNKNKIPCLMFNPAFSSESKHLQPIPDYDIELPPYENQMAVVGSEDKDVPTDNQLNFLNKTKAEIFIEKIDHDIPDDIKVKYFDEFIEKIQENKFAEGGNVFSASSRFRPYEPIFFEPPIVGVNGAKLISYRWAYEWYQEFDEKKGDTVSKRISDWDKAIESADTGKNIVHQFTVLMPNGETKTISSESVLISLGYADEKQLKSFPSLVNSLKTLAKQKMQLTLTEAQQKQYDELRIKFEKADKPQITKATLEQLPEITKFIIERGDNSTTYFAMGNVTYGQPNESIYNEKEGKSKYIQAEWPNKNTIEQLTYKWIDARIKENGGSRPKGLYDLKNRVKRQEQKVKQITQETSNETEQFADGGELKTIQYGDSVIFTKDSDKKSPIGNLPYLKGNTGHVVNIYNKDGELYYTVRRGMTNDEVPATDVVLHKKDVREKVEEILTEKQQKKAFKDIGKRVSGSQKEKIALGNIINLSDLKAIEEDEITAIKTVVKERVYPEINVEEQKALGVTSGAAYIKIETRKACGNTPPNAKNKRASYVKFINKFTQDTYNTKTVKEIQDIYYSYEKWTPNEVIGYLIDPSFLESTDEVKQKLEKFFNEKFRFGRSYVVKQLVTEIFGKRFANFMFGGSDAARKTWHEAKSFEPVSKEESDSLIAKDKERKHKFIDANKQKVEHFKSAIIEVLKSEIFNFSFGDYHKKLFKQDIESFRKWAIDYYQKRADDGIKSLEVTPPHIQQRENNWEWYEKSPEKRVIKKSQEIQINSGKPLAFIKRVGGVKIADEYVDKTKETDLSKNPITNDFGFKTVQFGQSLQDKSAKEHIRHFLGAMSDMSELLGIDIKSLNKIGNLSIAFASRGKRGALAHFEAGRKIINITDKRGDGTINHEYFHYIDNALTTIGKEGISLTFGSDDPDKILNTNVAVKIKAIMDFIYKGKAGITEPVKVLFKKEARSYSVAPKFYSHRTGTKAVTMLNTIDETIELLRVEYPDIVSVNTKYTDYQKNVFGYIINHFGLNEYEVPLSMTTSNFFYGSNKMSSAYWIRPWELFARASETYMYDKLVKNNRFNNYLVNDDMFYETMLNNGQITNVYPYGKEREYLYTLYDNFIDTIKIEYNLASFTPVSDKREDEYLVLEENQEVDENVDAGVVVDAKTDKVEEIIHDNKEVVTEMNNSDYESAMDLAKEMVELTEGKEKQDWLDYIDILNIMKVK